MRASRFRVDFFDRDHRRRFAANIRGGVSSSSSVVGFGSIGSVTTTALFSGAVQPAPREEPVEHDDDDDSLFFLCALLLSNTKRLFLIAQVWVLIFFEIFWSTFLYRSMGMYYHDYANMIPMIASK